MKKGVIITVLLLIACLVSGQAIQNVSNTYKAKVTSTGGYSTEYQAVYDAMTTKPSTYDENQNTLVVELKAAGVWSKADGIGVFAQESNDDGEALINWIAPSTKFTNGGATFTALEGFDGAATYTIATGIIPYNGGYNYTQDDACIAVYLREDLSEDRQVWGLYSGGPYTELSPRNTSNNMVAYMNAGTSNSVAVTTSLGLITISRTSSTAVEFYQGGTSLTTVSKTRASLLNAGIILLGRTAASGTKSNNQMSFVYVGAGLSDTEVADMNTAVEKYMDAVGKGVQ